MVEVKYKQAIASVLKCNPEQVFLYWKGRVALYAILKAMGIKEGDEIIIPAFTCVVVPNAILYLGAIPVYVDICPDTYNMDTSKLEAVITNRTKAIICQNTFGLSTNIEVILDLAKNHNLFTIEDCSHGFGGTYNGRPNGSYCDAAFYSTQWNKPFSTGIGGFLVVNNNSLVDKVKMLETEKYKPTLFEQIILTLLLFFRAGFINKYTYWTLVGLYRFLSNNNLIIGSSQGNELLDIKLPKKYFKDISAVQIYAGIIKLGNIDSLNKLRKKNAYDYTRLLKEFDKTYVKEKFFDNHLFLKYPVLVKNRKQFFILAQKLKVILGDWFISPLYPVKGNLSLWGYNPELFPRSVEISKKIVNLPTDIKNNSKVLELLLNYQDMIE
jgi:perosamine synthetase